jgi:hypothetical protein
LRPIAGRFSFPYLNQRNSMKRNNKKQNPSPTDKVKANQEETKRILAEAAQIQQRAAKQLREDLESILIRRLAALSGQEPLNHNEIELVISQLEQVRGIEKAPKVNHCKTCLFQKLCPKFTGNGRNGLSCNFAEYNNSIRAFLRKGTGHIIYDQDLQFWDNSQEELDARFILS